ncbi:MAG TPA: hybrid sensor histidine kinase/response regulator [Usitatibacter sp.]|nr:hybrid sensor histidine kinase/response regulator [Usitatibacter sp.]
MARDASGLPDAVLSELLEHHFGGYPRQMTAAAISAAVVVGLLALSMAGPFLWSWLAFFILINIARGAVSRACMGPARDKNELRLRTWVALASHAVGGLAWGVLGAVTLTVTPEHPENTLVVFFIVAVFATYQAANPSRYEPAYYSWLLCAMVPIIGVSAVHLDSRFHFLAALGALFLFSVTLIGRRSNAVMIDSIVKRHENARLLADLLAQREELEEANRAKTRFFAAASHDLRQPMQAMVLLVESLHERVQEPGARRIVESIDSSVAAMSTLLNELLDISRFDAGTVKVERSAYPVARVLDRLRSNFSQAAAQKGLAFRVHRSPAVIHTDSVLLYRVLVNLVNNALRYTRTGGVLVGCRKRPAGLWIEVWDTGVGIAKEDQKAIFREFHQLANPQRDREQGLGLGLAIVERSCRLLDMPIEVRSRVGRGTVFAVRVPYGDPSRVVTAERSRAADTLDGLRVLVLDDDKEILAAMRGLLEGWGCEVAAAGSGEAVDAQLAAFTPDVILADYRLPGPENGIQVVDRLRRRLPDVDGIVISGDIGAEVLRTAQASSYHLMHKPLRPAKLRALLGSMLRARHASERIAQGEESA